MNLTKLELRLSRQGLGHLCFVMDLEGHISNEVVACALPEVKARRDEVKFLGSYPAAATTPAPARRPAIDAERRADDWIDELRHRVR